MKLVQKEAESEALRQYLRQHRLDERVTSALARVEVVRAVRAGGAAAVALARRQINRLHHVVLDPALLDSAAAIAPGTLLPSIDAIHLASALLIGSDLRAIATYDQRLADAATAMGLPTFAPC